MKADSEELQQRLALWNQAAIGSFVDYLGCEVVEANEQRVVMCLQIQPHHLNLIGIVHGGVHATLIDSAMGLLAMIAKPEASVVTTNLNLNYVTKAVKGSITVTAELVHISRKSVTTMAYARLDQGEICAFGTGTFRVT
ncbi:MULTISPECIES: PaaI family thioesterase [Paenibacillus]|uniref:PaaI family thioesterase n=1 Tax=Paenibacillus TaxID=44249 RepID=UPI0028FD198F|nr:PaaI family thioesterase [Paenibacillus sp. 3LSP]MDU0332745.1 PaaI family thioesterase [Paenibacillus sp. 3LSP]